MLIAARVGWVAAAKDGQGRDKIARAADDRQGLGRAEELLVAGEGALPSAALQGTSRSKTPGYSGEPVR